MKKHSIRPFLTVATVCLLPAALHAQTTLQSPGGLLGESAAQPAGQSMATPMGQTMATPVSPAASISQPYSPVSSNPAESQPNTLKFRATAGIERDSNVLRAPVKTSDTIAMLGVGLKLDRRVGQQQFIVDAETNRYTFDNLSGLDYSTLNYSAAWLWRFGNQFEGVASADRRQFRDVTSNNLAGAPGISRRTERNELFEGGYRLGSAVRLLAGVQHNAARSSDPSAWDSNPDITSARVGAAYEFASGSSITARYRRGDGDYQGAPVVAEFQDNEFETVVRWAATAKTTVDARLAHLDREHTGAPTRDFSGLVGSFNVNWEATAKTRLQAGFARDLGSYLFGAGGHLSSDRYYIGPVYRPTTNTALNLRYEHETRNWEDVTGGADVGRRDKFNVLSAGFQWEPRRFLTVSTQLRNERRTSSLPAFNYRANVVGVAVKLTI